MMSAFVWWLLYFTVCLAADPSIVTQLPDSYSDKTYYLVNEMKNWTDAKSHCEQNYTDLAVIYNQGDWKQVLAAVESSTSEMWIGLHRDREWKWSNGEDFMYFNWNSGWGTTSGYDCAYSYSGRWQTVTCAGYYTYMCQKVTNTSGILIKTYEYKSVSATWENARTSCKSENGELASITNKQDQQEFNKIAPNNTNIWIGLKRDNDVWKWSSEEPFQNWATNDSSPMKNCIKLSGDKKWTPEDCSHKYMFFCYTVTPTFTTESTNSSETTTVTPPTSSATSGTTLSNTPSLTPSFTTQSTSSSRWSVQPPTGSPAARFTTAIKPTSTAFSGTTLSNTPSYNLTYIPDQKNWIEARKYCRNHHKTLVHIINSTVQEYVTQMLQNKFYPNGVWIGLERNMRLTWLWTGGPNLNYSEWHSSFPVDPINHYCGKLGGNGTQWLDFCCREELPFICQD
ncbi:macrophage mannose receptor 1-like [Colossoma macropomum]|uniref:macrophage mannose receptor 1-like n=1 Tax=Colossoma macropomum TaxID=42526 RepID=UPI001864894A|nr:macrophage mannose receptor 1-like [Colossoma macropomum]